MESFTMKFDNHRSNMWQSFETLRNEEEFFDVTLISDDQKSVLAHKVVISACSSFFKNVFKNITHSHPLMYIPGVNSRELIMVMDFIYEGQVTVPKDIVERFLKLAQKFQLKGINTVEDTQRMSINETIVKGTSQSPFVRGNSIQVAPVFLRDDPNRNKFSQNGQFIQLEKRLKRDPDTNHFKTVQQGTITPGVSSVSGIQSQLQPGVYYSQVVEAQHETRHHLGDNDTEEGHEGKDFQVENHLGNPDFSTQTSYDEHMYQTADGGYKCKYCGKETARKWHMKNHVEIHLENSYQCRECLIVLKTRNALMKHQAKKHSLHPY